MDTCRHCRAPLTQTVLDLGTSPLCNTLVTEDGLNRGETFYPLKMMLCGNCLLAQVGQFVSPAEIFEEYSYFSSYSDSFVRHAEVFTERMIERFALGDGSCVFEVASNDGYLLQHFVARQVPVLGIEPALNVAQVARDKGVPTISEFLGEQTSERIVAQHGRADLVVANNVLAHTPDLNGFVIGLERLLGEGGVVSIEFPHLLRLLQGNQFDTIYHEHFSYFSFTTVQRILGTYGLRVFDVEELTVHGGSLRVLAAREGDATHPDTDAVGAMLELERSAGLLELRPYLEFAERVEDIKRNLLVFLIDARRQGKRVVGYGAPGKGNTLLNYCGIRTDFLDYLVDRNPYKQGKFAPGSRIPIQAPERILEDKPDYILILPWNIRDEIMAQMQAACAWGGKFVVAVPELQVLN